MSSSTQKCPRFSERTGIHQKLASLLAEIDAEVQQQLKTLVITSNGAVDVSGLMTPALAIPFTNTRLEPEAVGVRQVTVGMVKAQICILLLK